jgi:hypothetical protein
VPLLLLGGLLVLEHQAPLSPGGHTIAQVVLTLLMYGVLMYWLRRNRGALVNEAYEREQAQARQHTTRQPQRECVMDDDEPWNDATLPWHSHGHDIHSYRRQ